MLQPLRELKARLTTVHLEDTWTHSRKVKAQTAGKLYFYSLGLVVLYSAFYLIQGWLWLFYVSIGFLLWFFWSWWLLHRGKDQLGIFLGFLGACGIVTSSGILLGKESNFVFLQFVCVGYPILLLDPKYTTSIRVASFLPIIGTFFMLWYDPTDGYLRNSSWSQFFGLSAVLSTFILLIMQFIFWEQETISREKTIRQQQSALVRDHQLASLGTLSGGIGHEINNPLTIIKGTLRQLTKLDKPIHPKEPLLHEQIKNSVDRIATIVRSMMRIGGGNQFSSEPTSIDMHDLLKDVYLLARRQFQEHDVELIVPSNQKPVACFVDPSHMTSIIFGLLMNALDAARLTEEKWVEVTLNSFSNNAPQTEYDQLEIFIADSGLGIKPEVAKRMFDPFFTTKLVGTGGGLGLSTALKLARENSGDLIYLEEKPNTTFCVRLPIIIRSESPPPQLATFQA